MNEKFENLTFHICDYLTQNQFRNVSRALYILFPHKTNFNQILVVIHFMINKNVFVQFVILFIICSCQNQFSVEEINTKK